jgi:hypothetical protein
VQHIRWPQPLVSVYSELLTTQSIKSGYFPSVLFLPPMPPPPAPNTFPSRCDIAFYMATHPHWATMDHLPPPHHLTVYTCLHCLSYQTGWTPLYYASRYGHVSVAEMLLKSGADVNMADQVKCVGEMSTFDKLGYQQFWVYRNQWLRPADVSDLYRALYELLSHTIQVPSNSSPPPTTKYIPFTELYGYM